jgi:hypothetical protein
MKSARYLGMLMLFARVNIPAQQNPVDLDQKARDALVAYGVVPVTRMTPVPHTERHCHGGAHGTGSDCDDVTVYEMKPVTSTEILTSGPLRLRTDVVKFGAPVSTAVPSQMHVDERTYLNCISSVFPSWQISLSVSMQRSASASISKAVKSSVGGKVNFVEKFGDFTLGGEISTNSETTKTDVTTLGTQEAVTEVVSTTIPVPGQKKLAAQLQMWPITIAIPFATTIVIDADLGPNDRDLRHLSDIADIAARTFPVEGELNVTDASRAELVLYELPFNQGDCQQGGQHALTFPGGFVPPTIPMVEVSRRVVPRKASGKKNKKSSDHLHRYLESRSHAEVASVSRSRR